MADPVGSDAWLGPEGRSRWDRVEKRNVSARQKRHRAPRAGRLETQPLASHRAGFCAVCGTSECERPILLNGGARSIPDAAQRRRAHAVRSVVQRRHFASRACERRHRARPHACCRVAYSPRFSTSRQRCGALQQRVKHIRKMHDEAHDRVLARTRTASDCNARRSCVTTMFRGLFALCVVLSHAPSAHHAMIYLDRMTNRLI